MSSPDEFAKDFAAMGADLFDDIREGLLQWAYYDFVPEMEERASTGPLKARSGSLAGSFSVTETGTTAATWSMTVGTTSKYAPMQEYGGTVRPVRKKWLTIPLDAALTPAGVLRAPAPMWRDTFFARSKRGNLILFQKTGKKKITPLFVLKKQTKIPARLGFFDTWGEGKTKRGKILEEAALSASLENGGKRG